MAKSQVRLHTHILKENGEENNAECVWRQRRGCVCAYLLCLQRDFTFVHLEFLEVGAAFLPRGSHDVEEVGRENEGNPFLTDSHETLVIPQDVAKVDVEEVS